MAATQVQTPRSPFRRPEAEQALEMLFGLAGREPLWAVLDGAQDERISTWVRGGKSPWACLYAGELSRELEDVAPYLVRLYPGSPDTARVVDAGWERSWGVYVVTTAAQADLRRQLRRHLRVRTEGGKILLLRWYDPRVLRKYLPSCNGRELKEFFGPVRAFIGEGPQPRQLQIFTLQDGKLATETLSLP